MYFIHWVWQTLWYGIKPIIPSIAHLTQLALSLIWISFTIIDFLSARVSHVGFDDHHWNGSDRPWPWYSDSRKYKEACDCIVFEICRQLKRLSSDEIILILSSENPVTWWSHCRERSQWDCLSVSLMAVRKEIDNSLYTSKSLVSTPNLTPFIIAKHASKV